MKKARKNLVKRFKGGGGNNNNNNNNNNRPPTEIDAMVSPDAYSTATVFDRNRMRKSGNDDDDNSSLPTQETPMFNVYAGGGAGGPAAAAPHQMYPTSSGVDAPAFMHMHHPRQAHSASPMMFMTATTATTTGHVPPQPPSVSPQFGIPTPTSSQQAQASPFEFAFSPSPQPPSSLSPEQQQQFLLALEYPNVVSPEQFQAQQQFYHHQQQQQQFHARRSPGPSGRYGEAVPSSSSSSPDIQFLQQQLKDAHRVVKAVLGVDKIVDSSTSSLRAIRQYASMQKELSGLKKQLLKNQRQRQELETQWTKVCLERNQQAMQVASLEQSLNRQERENQKLSQSLAAATNNNNTNNSDGIGDDNDPNNTSLVEYKGGDNNGNNKSSGRTGGGATPVHDRSYEQQLEQQLLKLQHLLDQRHEELTNLQNQLAEARQNEVLVPDELVDRCKLLEQQLQEAHDEVNELEEERQLNMKEIVDLSKRLRSAGLDLPLDSSHAGEQYEQEKLRYMTAVEELTRQLEEAKNELKETLEQKDTMETEFTLRVRKLESQAQNTSQLKDMQLLVKVQQEQLEDWQTTSQQHEEQLATLRATLLQEQALRRTQLDIQTKQHKMVQQELMNQLQSATRKIQEQQEYLSREHGKVEGVESQFRQTRTRLHELENDRGADKIESSNTANRVLEDELEQLQLKFKEQQVEMRQQQTTMQDLCKELERARQDRQEMERRLREAQQIINKAAAEAEEEKDLPPDVLDLKIKLSEGRATIKRLQSELVDVKIRLEEGKFATAVAGDAEAASKYAKEHAAQIEDLETKLLDREAQVEELQEELKISNAAASAAAAMASMDRSELQKRGDGHASFLEMQLKEAKEELHRKEEEYGNKVEQIMELRSQLQKAQIMVEDLELERNYNLAKVYELNQLVLVEPSEAQEKLQEKAMECAELTVDLERTKKSLEENEKENEKLKQEREVNQAKVAELSGIWESLPKIEAAKSELEGNIERVAKMLAESQDRVKQLSREQEIAVDKASGLSIALAESKEAVEELKEQLEYESRENDRKDTLLQNAGIDPDADDVNPANENNNNNNRRRRNRFFKIKLARWSSEADTTETGRLQELEETLVQQQIQIAKLRKETKNPTDEELTQRSSEGELDADKAAGGLPDGDGAELKTSLSAEEAQELTIFKLMQKIEHLEEDKTEQNRHIDNLKKSLEQMQHENVSKAIRMEAMEESKSGAGGSSKDDILGQLKMTSASYTDSMLALRSELSLLRNSMEERAMENQSQMKQLEEENAALTVKISTLASQAET